MAHTPHLHKTALDSRLILRPPRCPLPRSAVPDCSVPALAANRYCKHCSPSALEELTCVADGGQACTTNTPGQASAPPALGALAALGDNASRLNLQHASRCNALLRPASAAQ